MLGPNSAIKIRLLGLRGSDLLMAVSDDLPGLVVHARTESDIEARLPGAIKDLLRAAGHNVVQVQIVRDMADTIGFGPPAYVANAQLHPQP